MASAGNRLFISYSRAHDEREPFVRKLRQDLIDRQFAVWRDRESMDSRGRAFLQEIRTAIAGCDRILAVVSPDAARSEYVRSEWMYALDLCRVIVPLLILGDHPLPEPLTHLHAVDFRSGRSYGDSFAELMCILERPIVPPGETHGAGALPPNYLLRTEELSRLQRTILAHTREPGEGAAASRTALVAGMTGIGKTVLATAAALSCDVRRAFADGVIWVHLGRAPDLLAALRYAGDAAGDDPAAYIDFEIAKSRFARALRKRECLLVLDDAWSAAHIAVFRSALGPDCGLLVTTRDHSLATSSGIERLLVDVLTPDAALMLLADCSARKVNALPPEAQDIASQCGNLPLALAMVGGMLGNHPDDRWPNVLQKLRSADLSHIGHELLNYEHPNLLRAIEVSVEALSAGLRARYLSLAVFPDATSIPETVLRRYWQPEGPGAGAVPDTVDALVNRSLIRRSDDAHVVLHMLQFDYVRAKTENVAELHRQLLAAYRPAGGWHAGPNDGYFFEHLAWHLHQAGQSDELRALLMDFAWIEAKLAACGIAELLADYEHLPADQDLSLVRDALRLSAHIVAKDPEQLAGQLIGRLLPLRTSGLDVLLERATNRGGTWVRPLTGTLSAPGGPLVRTLTGHSGWVTGVVVTPDSRRAVSVSRDRTVKVWDIDKGIELRTMRDRDKAVYAIRITPDGRLAVSGWDDGTVGVWDLASGGFVHSFEGHRSYVTVLAITPDGKHVVSGDGIGVLRLWNLETRGEGWSIRAHSRTPQGLAVTPDGSTVLSASDDCTIKAWDLRQGVEQYTIRGQGTTLKDLALLPDGRHAVSAGYQDGTLRLWDLQQKREVRVMEGNAGWTEAVAVTPDGRLTVSASGHAVIVWDLQRGMPVSKLGEHADNVQSIAVTPDGKRVLSGGADDVIKVWELREQADGRPRSGHSGVVYSIAMTPDGGRAISAGADRTLRIWDVARQAESGVLTGHQGLVFGVAVTPDGRQAVSCSYDGTLRTWDLERRTEIGIVASGLGVPGTVAITPNGRLAVVAASEGISIHNLERRSLVRNHADRQASVGALGITRDGRRAVYATTQFPRIVEWEFQRGKEGSALATCTSEINTLTMTRDSNERVIAGMKDGVIRVLPLRFYMGGDLTIQAHTGIVKDVAATPDGRRAVSVSRDRTLKVWDLARGQCLATFTADTQLWSCAITPDGVTILAGDDLGQVYFLRLEGVLAEHELIPDQRRQRPEGGFRLLPPRAIG